jgi:hypothetical protein
MGVINATSEPLNISLSHSGFSREDAEPGVLPPKLATYAADLGDKQATENKELVLLD